MEEFQRICENISFRSDVKNMTIVPRPLVSLVNVQTLRRLSESKIFPFVFLVHAMYSLNWQSVSEPIAPPELNRRIFQMVSGFRIDAGKILDAFTAESQWSNSNADHGSSQCHICIESRRYLRRVDMLDHHLFFSTTASFCVPDGNGPSFLLLIDRFHFLSWRFTRTNGSLARSSDACRFSIQLGWWYAECRDQALLQVCNFETFDTKSKKENRCLFLQKNPSQQSISWAY